MKANKTSLYLSINNKIKNRMALEIGQQKTTLIGLQDDVTAQPVAPIILSNVSVASDNPSIATASQPDNDNSVVIVIGVGTGACNVTVNATVKYTNSNGNQVTETKSKTIPVTVSPAPNPTSLTLNPAI